MRTGLIEVADPVRVAVENKLQLYRDSRCRPRVEFPAPVCLRYLARCYGLPRIEPRDPSHIVEPVL